MTDEECVPVKVALQLMDTSSLGRAQQYLGFKDTHHQLQYALQSIVNDHHQGFNSSIGTFHSIMRSITSSQGKVRELRESLLKSKDDLSTSKPEVRNMVESSQKYDTMLQTLQSIEHLQLVPEKLEARISEKRFLTAVDVLSSSLKMIRQPGMMEIGALSDLRTYLGTQESSLADILIEELHNHLYLKSLYCNDRWKAYSSNKRDASSGIGGGSDKADMAYTSDDGVRALHRFINSNDFTQPMVDDAAANKNPESDSLCYIRLVLEALNNLGHLSNAVSTVNQRLPVELFKLVDKTNNEVDQRHPSSLASGNRNRFYGNSIDFGLTENDLRVTVINDLLCTLYSKFEAVMEGHRVIYDVVRGISKRESIQGAASLANGFVEVWQLIQSEMRSLLHDYLTTSESRGAFAITPKGLHNAISNIITGKSSRDKSKILFKLSNVDTATPSLKEDQEDLQYILKASVPGLVSESLRPAVATTDNHNISDGAATGHKLLIEPSVFNITILLPPSLAFLNRLKGIVPTGSGIVHNTLPSFLDDFLVNVFYPSLEDTIRDLFAQTIGDLDAFHEDPQWTRISKRPVMKGTTAFLGLITAFCKMLDTLPPDQAFGQLTIDLLTSYYDKCYEWYREIVARHSSESEANSEVKTSAQWAQDNHIRLAMGEILTNDTSMNALKKETDAETIYRGNVPIRSADLITDRKSIVSLCILATSMKWIASKVIQLRHIEDPQNFSRNDGGNTGRVRRRWTLIDSVRTQDEGRPVYLPMTEDTISAFDGVVSSFQELTTTVLFTLRAEARCRTIHYLEQCLSQGIYCFDNPVQAPDTSIVALNSDLVWFDEDVSTYLTPQEVTFILSGLGALMDQILVTQADSIKILNKPGAQRMQTNILVLQQNLKNIEKQADLGRASRFYKLYVDGMDDLIANAKSGKLEFTYDELKVIVELYFSEAMSNRRESASALQARRSLNENLLALSEIMWTL
ncbi:Sec8 exocyst complex component-specific domain-containing protein [Geopyxis carbonaria]|nr:Sec8 exocyst complex component-specific domain-containing protein [Geopyxis carbonaria]